MQIYNHYRRHAVGIVAVSSVGTQANTESKRRFLAGYSEMMKRLEPETVIFYGNVPMNASEILCGSGRFRRNSEMLDSKFMR